MFNQVEVSFNDAVQPKLLKKVDAQGFLRSKARIARVGVQFYEEYGNVMRTAKVLADSALSFNNQVITQEHPDDGVNSLNAKDEQVGFITNVQVKGKWLIGDVTITDAKAVEDILSGEAYEFSCGYSGKLKAVKGDYLGEGYEWEVFNVVGNHISLVTEARAGNEATFIDSKANNLTPREGTLNIMDDKTVNTENTTEVAVELKDMSADYETLKTMLVDALAKIKMLENSIAYAADVVQYDSKDAKLDDAKDDAPAEDKDAKIALLEAKLDLLTDAADKAKAPETVVIYDGKEIAARVEVWSFVQPLLKDSVDVDYGMNVSEVRKLYLSQELPKLAEKIKEGSRTYINGLWDGFVGNTQAVVASLVPGAEPVAVPVPIQDSVDDGTTKSVEALSVNVGDSKSTLQSARDAYIARIASNRG